MDPKDLSDAQRRGGVLLLAFVVHRALLWRAFAPRSGTNPDPSQMAALVVASFLVGSVGIVYVGFEFWLGVDLRTWWVGASERRRLGRDVAWGLVGFVVAFAATATVTVVGLSVTGRRPPETTAAPSAVETLVLLVFGFAVASFQEETLFRGFLQTALLGRTGPRTANVVQAGAFALAHVGYYPLSAWQLYLGAFVAGLVYGFVRNRRERLLAPGIAHGLLG